MKHFLLFDIPFAAQTTEETSDKTNHNVWDSYY